MKRLTYVLLLIVLAIPLLAKAENNNPTIRPFEAIVVNEDGITFYNKDLGTNITYRKGEMITVYGNINGGLFLEGLDVSIGFSDIKLYKDYVEPTDKYISKLDAPKEMVVTKDSGLDIRKGPASLYEKVGHIDKGYKFNYTYYFESNSWISYVYIDQDGLTGWVELVNKEYMDNLRNIDSIVKERINYDLKVLITKDTTVNGTSLKANSLLDVKYDASPEKLDEIKPVVTVDNKDLILKKDYFYFYSTEKIKVPGQFKYYYILKKDVKLYSNPELTKETGGVIPKGETVQSLVYLDRSLGVTYENKENITYEWSFISYVDYNGRKGWIKLDLDTLSNLYYDIESDNLGEKITRKVNVTTTKTAVIIGVIIVVIIAIATFFNIKKTNKKFF